MIVQAKDRQTCSRRHHHNNNNYKDDDYDDDVDDGRETTSYDRAHLERFFYWEKEREREREEGERKLVARFCLLKGGAEHMCTETTQQAKALPV